MKKRPISAVPLKSWLFVSELRQAAGEPANQGGAGVGNNASDGSGGGSGGNLSGDGHGRGTTSFDGTGFSYDVEVAPGVIVVTLSGTQSEDTG